jgi:hypothetical protein
MARLGRKLARQAAQRAGNGEAPKPPHELIAVIRKARDGHLAVIEVVGQDVIADTVRGDTLEDTIRKAVDVMVLDVGEVATAKVLITGKGAA